MNSPREPAGFTALLRRRPFRTLLVGQTISSLGDWMGTVALMALVLDQSGSSTAVGGILALRLLPGAIGGPLAARAASRWDRRRTMVAMDLTRAGMVALVPLVEQLWWIYIWAFSLEVAGLVFLPARDASIGDLVDDEDLPLANGLVLGTSYGTIPLGAALFALLAALPVGALLGRGYALVFFVDAAPSGMVPYDVPSTSPLASGRSSSSTRSPIDASRAGRNTRLAASSENAQM